MNVFKRLNTLSRLLGLASALFGLGCQISSHAYAVTRGTSDGGGGNGVKNRVYESYIVNVTELDAYKKHLAPLFEKIQKDYIATLSGEEKERAKKNGNDLFQSVPKMKTWYLAPVTLNPLDKSVLGVSFSEDNTQQLAVQTSKEIWIDANTYGEMKTSEDQAWLILHEMVMNIYFIKYMKFTDLCKMSNEIEGTNKTCPPAMNDLLPYQKQRPLNKTDYERIRKVTAWLWSEGMNSTHEKIYQKFLNNGFDERVFNPQSENTQEKQSPLEFSAVKKMVEDSILLNKAPSTCIALNSGLTTPCALSTQRGQIQFKGHDIPTYKITAFDKEHGLDVNFEAFDSVGMTVWPSKFRDYNNNQDLYMLSLATAISDNPMVGQKIRFTFVIAKKVVSNTLPVQEKFELYALISYGIVLTEVNIPKPADKPEASTCRGGLPQPKNINEDIIVVAPPNSKLGALKWVAQAFKDIPVYCQ